MNLPGGPLLPLIHDCLSSFPTAALSVGFGQLAHSVRSVFYIQTDYGNDGRYHTLSISPLECEPTEGGGPRTLCVRSLYGPGMPRPVVSAETKEEIENLTDRHFRVPAHKVSFEERLQVLLEQVRTLQDVPDSGDSR